MSKKLENYRLPSQKYLTKATTGNKKPKWVLVRDLTGILFKNSIER